MEHVIPQLLSRGLGWHQPHRESILINDTHAVLSQEDFEYAVTYYRSEPSVAKAGKIWKTYNGTTWYLCWYNHSKGTECREITIMDWKKLMGVS